MGLSCFCRFLLARASFVWPWLWAALGADRAGIFQQCPHCCQRSSSHHQPAAGPAALPGPSYVRVKAESVFWAPVAAHTEEGPLEQVPWETVPLGGQGNGSMGHLISLQWSLSHLPSGNWQ